MSLNWEDPTELALSQPWERKRGQQRRKSAQHRAGDKANSMEFVLSQHYHLINMLLFGVAWYLCTIKIAALL